MKGFGKKVRESHKVNTQKTSTKKTRNENRISSDKMPEVTLFSIEKDDTRTQQYTNVRSGNSSDIECEDVLFVGLPANSDAAMIEKIVGPIIKEFPTNEIHCFFF